MASGPHQVRRARWLLPPIAAGLALIALELGLRVVGFEYHFMPAVQFGWPDPKTLASNYDVDPDLFWVTKDYHQKLHAAMEAHPGIVFLGDSCTEFGTYPARTLQRLTAERATMHAGLHLASGGWSSEQGLAQLQRDVLPLRPHVVVIYFGWNDHWIALGPPDADLRAGRGLFEMAEYSRLAQLLLKGRMSLSSHGDRPLRVPPDRYLHNLEEMSQLARQAGIMPVLVTAASNHVPGQEPAYLLARHLTRLSDLVPLHQQYVSLTRQAAAEAHAVLCDAAAAFGALPQPHAPYFRSDGIHFTERGDEELAGIVSRCIVGAVH